MAGVAPSRLGRLAHLGYDLSLIAKGALGLAQLAAGGALVLAPPGFLPDLLTWLSSHELAQDPQDPLVAVAVRLGQGAQFETTRFYILYFLIHGVLNLGLVLALVARLGWAYPASIAALGGFIVYQMVKFTQTGDPVMILLSVIDVAVIASIWHEWRVVHRAALIPKAST